MKTDNFGSFWFFGVNFFFRLGDYIIEQKVGI